MVVAAAAAAARPRPAAAAAGAAAAAERPHAPLKVGAACPSLENFWTLLDRGAAATFSDVFVRFRGFSSEVLVV